MRAAGLSFGRHQLWQDLDLDVSAGEFLAVLGPNGAGKSTLLTTILGLQTLSHGSVELFGNPVTRGSTRVGYIPQQKIIERGTPLRARDLVALGVDGNRWGLPIRRHATRLRVSEVLEGVGVTDFANVPAALLSGGQQQRVRVGQAIAARPSLLLCDEPLSSLDLHQQRVISELIDEQRREHDTAVIFVTHDINPILPFVDRVLYLAHGRYRLGSPDEVLRSDVLSELYDTDIEVINHRGRIVVLGVPGDDDGHDHDLAQHSVAGHPVAGGAS